jgi:hypothetical protein
LLIAPNGHDSHRCETSHQRCKLPQLFLERQEAAVRRVQLLSQ